MVRVGPSGSVEPPLCRRTHTARGRHGASLACLGATPQHRQSKALQVARQHRKFFRHVHPFRRMAALHTGSDRRHHEARTARTSSTTVFADVSSQMPSVASTRNGGTACFSSPRNTLLAISTLKSFSITIWSHPSTKKIESDRFGVPKHGDGAKRPRRERGEGDRGERQSSSPRAVRRISSLLVSVRLARKSRRETKAYTHQRLSWCCTLSTCLPRPSARRHRRVGAPVSWRDTGKPTAKRATSHETRGNT